MRKKVREKSRELNKEYQQETMDKLATFIASIRRDRAERMEALRNQVKDVTDEKLKKKINDKLKKYDDIEKHKNGLLLMNRAQRRRFAKLEGMHKLEVPKYTMEQSDTITKNMTEKPIEFDAETKKAYLKRKY